MMYLERRRNKGQEPAGGYKTNQNCHKNSVQSASVVGHNPFYLQLLKRKDNPPCTLR
eukprot:NODE_9083_length_271_cov_27.405405_g8343_i0.p2 GENE.NODE_9083_length_271_cov_27.405405_g8343_i0~~NODE_9083_length_271_cov_27.405405_g8343_i0.p2  ORF type:complete len:57 (+),score=9.75 NODE_9083_length_271_cov_27.405405_g8343_i0:98-268(+)